MTIKEYATETDLAGFDKTWEDFRLAARSGITALPDVQLRNLFVQMTMLQSHAEMRVALLESMRDRKKLDIDLERSKLLVTTYTTGPMTKRNAEVEGDKDYQEKIQALQSYDTDVTIAKGVARACSIAASGLSRELSARLKE